MNYDGAPKFRSSGMQVWPVQFIINELPPQVRCVYTLWTKQLYYCDNNRSAKEHILTGGVWCSCQKPSTSAFLQPIMKRLKQMEAEGNNNKWAPVLQNMVTYYNSLCLYTII